MRLFIEHYFVFLNIVSGDGLVQQGINWANTDPILCRHVALRGPSELTYSLYSETCL